jgi:hypothetical protein
MKKTSRPSCGKTRPRPRYEKLTRIWTEEELIELPIDVLDRLAFGFESGTLLDLCPEEIAIIYPDDLVNPYGQIESARRQGISPHRWAAAVSFKEPCEVSFRNGRFELEDGHHRYTAAKILGRQLPCIVEIKDNPVTTVLRRQLG